MSYAFALDTPDGAHICHSIVFVVADVFSLLPKPRTECGRRLIDQFVHQQDSLKIFDACLEALGEAHWAWIDGNDRREAFASTVEEQRGDVAIGVVGDALVAANREEAGQWEMRRERFEELTDVIGQRNATKYVREQAVKQGLWGHSRIIVEEADHASPVLLPLDFLLTSLAHFLDELVPTNLSDLASALDTSMLRLGLLHLA